MKLITIKYLDFGKFKCKVLVKDTCIINKTILFHVFQSLLKKLV